MASDNADRGRGWNGDDQPQEAEQLPESKQREHQPDRVKPDRFADELRREHVALEELTCSNNAERQQEQLEARPSLKEGKAQGKHERGQRSDIGHEAQDAGDDADQKTIVEPDQCQAKAVPDSQEQADDRLAADETGQSMVYLAGDFSQALAMIERKPGVELRDHPVPVDENVKRDDGRDDQERQEIEQRGSAGHERV